jgi:hypothetical protein
MENAPVNGFYIRLEYIDIVQLQPKKHVPIGKP